MWVWTVNGIGLGQSFNGSGNNTINDISGNNYNQRLIMLHHFLCISLNFDQTFCNEFKVIYTKYKTIKSLPFGGSMSKNWIKSSALFCVVLSVSLHRLLS